MTAGYIKLYRQIEDNPLWTAEPFTKGQAWVDLLIMANHEPSGFTVRGVWVKVERGEVARGEQFLSKKWCWSRNKLRRFLNWLETEQQIKQQKNNVITVVSIVNWEQYQGNGTADGTTNDTTERQQKNIYKNEKNVKNKDITPFFEWGFEVVWNRYPRKLGKKESQRHFNATVKDFEAFNKIIFSLERFLSYHKVKATAPEFIPHGSTWFNNWADWLEYKEPKPKGGNIA